MKKIVFILFFVNLMAAGVSAQQFDMSAEIRPRFENKHGFKTLLPEDGNGASFISQRSRLNFKYKHEKIKFGVTLQNVRVWGDVSTLSSSDIASSFHEAWAEAILSDKVSMKMGRQEIVYDDHRIFGNVGWAQQARSHDAFIFKFTPNEDHRVDVGFALNADGQGGLQTVYSGAAGYKSFQYAWYHGDFDKLGLSFLLLNTGGEYINEDSELTVDYMQTIGPRLTYKLGDLSLDGAAYFQTGKRIDTDVSASYFAVNAGYKVSDEFSVGAGFEFLSGKEGKITEDNDIKSFAPLFGTNHKFNGWMDYFYVGNHGGNVGLMDIHATLGYKKNDFSAKLVPHFFSAAEDVYNLAGEVQESNLGTEIDLMLGYKISSTVNLQAGYSLMFATETMEVLKSGSKDETNSWGWVMFTFKPKLFSYKHVSAPVE